MREGWQRIKVSTNLDNDQNTPERVRANFDSSIKSNNSITNVLQVISGICKDNKNKLNSNVISHMFCVLSNLIDTSKLNKDMIKTKDLFSVIRDVIKSTDKLETFVYNRMFDCLIKVEQLNLNNTADKTEILFKLIQQFWEKDSDIFNNGLIEYIFDTLNELSNEKCDDNKVSLIKAVDIFNLICAIQKKKGKALTKSVILSMFRTLENAIELGSIENLTTENVFNLINDILKCEQINDAIGNLFAVLDKLNRKKYKLKQKQNAKAIDIFKSIDYWCREKIMGLMGIIILPIFQALESTMMICDVDGFELDKVMSLFNDIWNNEDIMLANSSNTNYIIQHMFGVLLFAIKNSNITSLKSFKVQNIITLCYKVYKKLKKQNEQIGERAIRPMFTALEYALKKCDANDIKLDQIIGLLADMEFMKNQKFSVATVKSIFNVLFATMKIKNIEDEMIKELFDKIELSGIGLSLTNNEIVLKNESKNSKDGERIDCGKYVSLLNEQLEKIIDTETHKTSNLKINNPNQGNENTNKNIEVENKQTKDENGNEDKNSEQTILVQQNIDPTDFLIKNDVDTKQITLRTLNGYFHTNIGQQDVGIGFWEWICTCVKMLFLHFSVFRRNNYHVSQHLLFTKYLNQARQKSPTSNKINQKSLADLFVKLKRPQNIEIENSNQNMPSLGSK